MTVEEDFERKFRELVEGGDILPLINARCYAIVRQMEREGVCCCYKCHEKEVGSPDPFEGIKP